MNADEELLLEKIPSDGSPVSNIRLKRELTWDGERYLKIRAALLAAKVIVLGKGKGGSVKLARPTEVNVTAVGTWPVQQTTKESDLHRTSAVGPTRLVIPLLNVGTSMFEIPKWNLSNDTFLCQIADEDFATLHREAEDQYDQWLKARTVCVNVDDPPVDNREEYARSVAVSLAFVFNTFAIAAPLILWRAAYLTRSPENHHALTVDLHSQPVGNPLTAAPFSLRKLANPEPLSSLYKIIRAVVDKNEAILVTLDRFNTSLLRTNPYDQIIDITISLESIVESSTEIKFRFSLFNSLVAETDPKKRRATFEMLKTLYDARSAIVHGDVHSGANKKKIEQTRQNMREIHKAAVAVISYYLLYQFKDTTLAWKDHVEGLALGEEARVTD